VSTHRGFVISFTLLTAAVALAGCSSGVKPGSAGNIPSLSFSTQSTAPQSTSSSDSSGSTGSAPKVSSPLNPAPLLSDACSGLSASQVSSFGLKTGQPRTIETGTTCSWRYNDGTSNTVNISPLVPNKNGLSDLYDQKDSKAYFEPTQIAGYPAVYTDIVDSRNRGRCSLYVGVTDQLAVFVFTQLDDGADVTKPCPVADKIGAAMVQTLKKG